MKKNLLFVIIIAMSIINANAQSINDSYFKKVSYVGAFGEEDWTKGWSNFDPQNTEYPATTSVLGNGELSYAAGEKITANKTISGIVNLKGWVYVKEGATLTIEKGTIIRGESAAALIIERGGKIIAEGTVSQPIIFTSNKAKGLRNSSDWGGLIICGKASNNQSNDVTIEGGVGATYGAPGGTSVDNDNSGILKYVRLEFCGYDIDGAGNEINSLTMGSVGSGTTIEYVQCSFGGDDSFEWFGGTVNCRNLIALATEDDDFDCDFGFRGMVQFALSVRNPKVCDNDGARGFECDNDAKSSYKKPYTSPVFSNVTLLGPGVDESANKKHDAAMMLRRNTRMQLYNIVATGYVKGGVYIDGDVTQKAAKDDSLKLYNSIFAGNTPFIKTVGTTNPLADSKKWLIDNKNDTIVSRNDLKIQFPVELTAPVFIPTAGSPIFTKGSSFGKAATKIEIAAAGNVTTFDAKDNLQLTATVSPSDVASTKVVWSVTAGDDVASINENGLVTAKKAGSFTAKAIATDGSGQSATINLTVTGTVGISSLNNVKSIVWPNPAKNIISVTSPKEISNISIYNITGVRVLNINNSNSNKVTVNLSSLPSGIYFLKIAGQIGNFETQRIIKN